MADKTEEKPEGKPPGDAKPKKEEKKKKGIWEIVFTVLTAVLAIVIFFFILNPLLGMLFPQITLSMNITANGIQGIAREVLHFRVAFSSLLVAVIGVLVQLLLLIIAFLLAGKIVQALVEWAKPKPKAA